METTNYTIEYHGKQYTIIRNKDGKFVLPDELKKLKSSFGGAQFKPAVEIVIVAMKPLSKKTYVEQALDNSKGVTWLDDCRIPYQSDKDMNNHGWSERDKRDELQSSNWGTKCVGDVTNPTGRFPANLLVSDDVLNNGKVSKSNIISDGCIGGFGASTNDYGNGTVAYKRGYSDSGSYSRYFDLDKWHQENNIPLEHSTYPFLIVPKSSKSQKNSGCEDLYILKSDTPENIRKEIMAYV